MVSFDISGVIAPVFTPISISGAVNLDVIQAYASYLAANGISTILVDGTTGEFASLNVQERNDLLDAWLKAAKPLKIKVIVQVGGTVLPDVIKMAEYAEKIQADAIMTLPELYFKPRTAEQIVSYLEVVSEAAPSLPLLYYHFPMMSGVNINVVELFSLAKMRISNFMGIKADLEVAVQVNSQLTGGRKVYIANHLLGPSALLGHESSIATVNNMFPTLAKDIVMSTKMGEVAQARSLQEKLNTLVNGINSYGDFVPSMKVAMELLSGIKVGPPRLPQKPLNEIMKSRIEDHLRALKTIVSFDISGVIAPVFTPISISGAVNLDVIQAYASYLAANGISTILVGGTTGEFASLNVQERNDLLDAWLKAAKPLKIKVIVQVGGTVLPDVIKMAEYAEKIQADAIMTLPELYFKPRTAEQIVSYLEVVSEAAPSLPLLYYHFPMMSGVNINVVELFSLAKMRIANFMGIKADLEVAVQVNSQLTGGRKVYIANHLLGPSALLGHESSIATVNNMFPTLAKDIVMSTKMGEVAQARSLQEKLNTLVNGINSYGDFVPPMKVAMELLSGIEVGPPKLPQKPLSEIMKSRIEDHLRALKTIV